MSSLIDMAEEWDRAMRDDLCVREILTSDAAAALGWLNEHIARRGGSAPFPAGILPSTGLGAYRAGSLLAACFVYFEGTSSVAVAMMNSRRVMSTRFRGRRTILRAGRKPRTPARPRSAATE